VVLSQILKPLLHVYVVLYGTNVGIILSRVMCPTIDLHRT
jgi:hypothetical protein